MQITDLTSGFLLHFLTFFYAIVHQSTRPSLRGAMQLSEHGDAVLCRSSCSGGQPSTPNANINISHVPRAIADLQPNSSGGRRNALAALHTALPLANTSHFADDRPRSSSHHVKQRQPVVNAKQSNSAPAAELDRGRPKSTGATAAAAAIIPVQPRGRQQPSQAVNGHIAGDGSKQMLASNYSAYRHGQYQQSVSQQSTKPVEKSTFLQAAAVAAAAAAAAQQQIKSKPQQASQPYSDLKRSDSYCKPTQSVSVTTTKPHVSTPIKQPGAVDSSTDNLDQVLTNAAVSIVNNFMADDDDEEKKYDELECSASIDFGRKNTDRCLSPGSVSIITLSSDSDPNERDFADIDQQFELDDGAIDDDER
ncbi:hypothetical protein BpHYR1_046070 [Brachionus plicatilis]|uniref:Uncharacterized protein n=1 Tax=Brachionus plicatilis TaxID=10195 RepID=A0A3M7SQR7_BRAPC|nr:hypothetical protein BpHYR1_046070 [Brachionus plicatilis]